MKTIITLLLYFNKKMTANIVWQIISFIFRNTYT